MATVAGSKCLCFKNFIAISEESWLLMQVPITSELGAVTPWIVTPGNWTAAELDTHAKNVAQAIYNNNSCNCNAAKVGVLNLLV